MARTDLPPPLPPESRTVGQLVAESIQAYRAHVLGALAIGVSTAVVDVVGGEIRGALWFAVMPFVGAALLTPAFIGAVLLVSGARPGRRRLLTAYAAGALAFLPFPVLVSLFLLPGLAWLALVGLCVPVALLEDVDVRASFARAYRLARADYVHVLGGLATLGLVVFLTRTLLFFLLRGFGESTTFVASVLADVVVSPLLFLGAALLYEDQAARLDSGGPRPKRRSDADLHPAVDADRPGRPDAEVEPRAAARGEP